MESPLNYGSENINAYANAAYERAVGKHIVSSEFNFSPDDLAYIDNNYIPLDHQQLFSLSAGGSYDFGEGTRLSTDLLYGTGLRAGGVTPNGSHVPSYVTVNFGVSQDFSLMGWKGLTARFDIINILNKTYEIRDGSGVGQDSPQLSVGRGFFTCYSTSH